MVKRQVIDVLLPFNASNSDYLLFLVVLLVFFGYFWRQSQDSCHDRRGQAGAMPGVYVCIYTETHRSGKLSVNHKGN
tara:strand:+ start:151 stop:381 length:231 start_codon:yes stop_codon:yes gene_type:complete